MSLKTLKHSREPKGAIYYSEQHLLFYTSVSFYTVVWYCSNLSINCRSQLIWHTTDLFNTFISGYKLFSVHTKQSTFILTWLHLHFISLAMWPEQKNETSLFSSSMCPSLDFFFLLCHVQTLGAFIPHTPAAHTTPLCVALSSYRALKKTDRESRGVLFFRGRALLFAVIGDANSPSVLLRRSSRFTQYLSDCVTVCYGCVCSADCPGETHTARHPHLHYFYFWSPFL